ncbi:MAG: hypothetical protein ACAH59_00485 [Pseudobdellovibrionaceae bacterium]
MKALPKFLFIGLRLLAMVTVLTAVGQAEPGAEKRLQMRQSMIEFVVQKLPNMIYGYVNSLEKQPLSQSSVQTDYKLGYTLLINRNRLSAFPIRYVSDSEFKVHNIDLNRLAINTGDEILIHADRLGEMKDFSIFQATQLMLHEFNHLITEVKDQPHRKDSPRSPVTLKEKDQFDSRLIEYLKSRTFSVDIENKSEPTVKSQYSILEMDEPKRSVEIYQQYVAASRESDWSDRYLAWQIHDDYFQEDASFRNRLRAKEHQVFSKAVSLSLAQLADSGLIYNPRTEVQEVSVSRSGEITVRVAYTERVFGPYGESTIPIAKPTQYVRQISGLGGRKESVSRSFNFRNIRTDLSFQIAQIIPKAPEAFVTLNLLEDSIEKRALTAQLLEKGTISVLARDESSNSFSFRASALNNKETGLRLQFRIPHIQNLTVTEILIQTNLNSADYQEHSIRPRKVQNIVVDEQILAGKKFSSQQLKRVDEFDLWMGTSDHTVSLTLPFDFDLAEGLTLEIRAPVEVTLSQDRGERYPKYHQTIGYKLFLDRKQLEKFRVYKDRSQLKIPLAGKGWGVQKIEGATTANDIRYLEDTGLRGVTNVWAHLKNGENIKLGYTGEPVARIFSKTQQEWDRRAKEARRKQYRASSCSAIHFAK